MVMVFVVLIVSRFLIFEDIPRIATTLIQSVSVMVQDAPLSGVTLGVPLLAWMARELPLIDFENRAMRPSGLQDGDDGGRRHQERPVRHPLAPCHRRRAHVCLLRPPSTTIWHYAGDDKRGIETGWRPSRS